MVNRQALGIDINEFARTGGIHYELVKEHFQKGEYDFLIIKAGLGLTKSPLLDEQRENAELHRIPFATYHLIDPRHDMTIQAQKYVEWVGANEPVYIVDVEKPAKEIRPRNRSELLRYIDELVRLTNKQPVLYSRANLLKEIGLLLDAKQFRLWIAQYPFDKSLLPSQEVQYRYFHDFTRDFANKLPPSILKTGLEENVILWQFSEKGNGPYYIYNPRTAHPTFTEGMKQADLNISIQGRDEFMQSFFGGVPQNAEEEDSVPASGPQPTLEPTYPGITNQAMINLIYKAARPFTDDPWLDWIVRANMEHMAIPTRNREKPYTGLKIEQIPSWTAQEKQAVLALL